MTEQEMIARLAKAEAQTERVLAWVTDLARDIKDTNRKLDALTEELSRTRETIAAFKGKVNVIIGIAATAAGGLLTVAIKLMFH